MKGKYFVCDDNHDGLQIIESFDDLEEATNFFNNYLKTEKPYGELSLLMLVLGEI